MLRIRFVNFEILSWICQILNFLILNVKKLEIMQGFSSEYWMATFFYLFVLGIRYLGLQRENNSVPQNVCVRFLYNNFSWIAEILKSSAIHFTEDYEFKGNEDMGRRFWSKGKSVKFLTGGHASPNINYLCTSHTF